MSPSDAGVPQKTSGTGAQRSTTTLRPISAAEFPEYFRCLTEAFNSDVKDADREQDLAVFEPERSLAAFDGKDIVGTAGIYTRTMTVPGGRLPVAGVTLVSVAPTHRRRGVLTAMIRRQLTELYEQQLEPVAALWASESVIYQRFGYGQGATGAKLTARTPKLALRPEADTGGGRVRLAGEEEARPHLAAVYEAVRPHSPGFLDRNARWWDNRLYNPEHHRQGATSLRFALHEEPDGQITGYAVYRTTSKWDDWDEPASELSIREMFSTTPQAYAATWSYLASLDLVRKVERFHGPLDEPLTYLVADTRAVQLQEIDNLWVRVADVGRALAGRGYAAELDIVLEVADPFCPWNAGRWRLSAGQGGASCERTADPADLALTSTELGVAYLGGTSLHTLAAAGRVRELRAGALRAAATAFAAERPPWCPEIF
jgi:predicted acetyltransferase